MYVWFMKFKTGDISVENELGWRSGNAINNKVSRDITENNQRQGTTEIIFQMKERYSTIILSYKKTKRRKWITKGKINKRTIITKE